MACINMSLLSINNIWLQLIKTVQNFDYYYTMIGLMYYRCQKDHTGTQKHI